MRLNKFLAERMGISRREADGLILGGLVKINGKVAVVGEQVNENQKISVNGKDIDFQHQFTYLILNKPRGYVCSRRQQGSAPTLYDLLPKKFQTLKTVGRLDRDSSGLIILTDDGDFAFKMTHPKFFKIKTYIVKLDRPLEPLHQQMISDIGITLPDGVSKFFITKMEDDTHSVEKSGTYLKIEMSEGRNRQIRRTFAALGYDVEELHRIEFGAYSIGALESGKYTEVSKK